MLTPFSQYIKTPYFIAKATYLRLARDSFLHYILYTMPTFVAEEVHVLMSDVLDDVIAGKETRIMFNMPPRTSKSEMMSVRFPAYYISHNPLDHILHCTHTADLTLGFSRQIRNLIQSEEHQDIFPEIRLKADEKSARHWAVFVQNQKAQVQPGVYNAAGAGSAVSGKGFHLGLVDDALSEQDAFSDDRVYKINHNWWGPGFYTRMSPDKNIILMAATRWRIDDLPNFVLDLAKNDPEYREKWKVVSYAAIIGPKMAKRLNSVGPRLYEDLALSKPNEKFKRIDYAAGTSFAPRRHSLKHIKMAKASMTDHYFQALYQQTPVKKGGVIIMRAWWRKWPYEQAPEMEFIVSCYDTAFEEDEQATNDSSARTTWGIFRLPDQRAALILLESWEGTVGFPELKKEVVDHYNIWHEDLILVEKRASGASLIQELRRTKVPIRPWLPPGKKVDGTKVARARGKIPRTHAAAILFSSGMVWYMEGPKRDHEQTITQTIAFPFGGKDDRHDTVTMAVLYLRDRVDVKEEEIDEEEDDLDAIFEPAKTRRQQRYQEYRRGR